MTTKIPCHMCGEMTDEKVFAPSPESNDDIIEVGFCGECQMEVDSKIEEQINSNIHASEAIVSNSMDLSPNKQVNNSTSDVVNSPCKDCYYLETLGKKRCKESLCYKCSNRGELKGGKEERK